MTMKLKVYKIPERMREVKQCEICDADRVETTKVRSPTKRAWKDLKRHTISSLRGWCSVYKYDT